MAGKPRSSQQAVHLALNGHNAVGAPHYATMSGHNIQDDVKAFYTGLPGYEQLFGGLNGSACDHDWSLLSPAAYYADLLQLIETHISAPEGMSLRDRRPDLFAMKLDPEQTNSEMPYLQLINQLLMAALARESGILANDDSSEFQMSPEQIEQEVLREFALGNSLGWRPYNRALEEIRVYLQHLDTDLASIFETVYGGPYSGSARARLHLSDEEYKLLIDSEKSKILDSRLFGLPVDALDTVEQSKSTWLAQIGLTEAQYDEMASMASFHGYMHAREVALAADDQAKDAFIFRFAYLAKKLDWSFSDLDWVLTSIGATAMDETTIVPLAAITELVDRTAVPLDQLTCFWHELMTIDSEPIHRSGTHNVFERTFNRNVAGVEQLVLTKHGQEDDVQRSTRAWLAASLKVEERELTQMLGYLREQELESYRQAEDEHAPNAYVQAGMPVTLTLPNLTQLYRLAQLPNLLNQSVDTALRLLRVLDQTFSEPRDLLALLNFNDWLAQSGLSVEQLEYLTWNDLWTYDGSVNQEHHPAKLTQNLAAQLASEETPGMARLLDLFSMLDQPGDKTLTDATEVDGRQARRQAVQDVVLSVCRGEPDKALDSAIHFTETFVTPQHQDDFLAQADAAVSQIKADNAQLWSRLVDTIADTLEVPSAIVQLAFSSTVEKIVGDLTPRMTQQLFYRFSIRHASAGSALDTGVLTAGLRDEFSRRQYTLSDEVEIKSLEKSNELGDFNRWHILDAKQPALYQIQRFGGRLDIYQLPYVTATSPEQPDMANWELIQSVIDRLLRLTTVANLLELSQLELQKLIEQPQWFGNDGNDNEPIVRTFRPDDIRNIQRFVRFRQELKGSDDGVLKLFERVDQALDDETLESAECVAESLATLTGWDLDYLKRSMTPYVEDDSIGPELEEVWGGTDKITSLLRLKAMHDLATKIGTEPAFLESVWRTVDINETDPLKRMAEDLLHLIRAKYDDERWKSVRLKLTEHLDSKLRDILVDTLSTSLNRNESFVSHFGFATAPGVLSNYLLVDLDNSGCDTISPLKLGLNSLQLYIHRCRNRLDPGIRGAIPAKEWAWMSHYRVWEANRKVYFFPENYLDPALRKNETPEFAELQSELLQGEITGDAVVKAYSNYFDKVEALAKLQIVNSYYTTVELPNEGRSENRLYLFGRSHTEPPVFYVRTALVAAAGTTAEGEFPAVAGWGPWQRIDLSINAKTVMGIFAFGKLFVFWVEQKKETRTDNIDGNSLRIGITKATVKYSFQTTSGKWLHPQTLTTIADKIINISANEIDQRLERIYAGLDADTRRVKVLNFVDTSSDFDDHMGYANADIPDTFLDLARCFTTAEFYSNYVVPYAQSRNAPTTDSTQDLDTWLINRIIARTKQTDGGIMFQKWLEWSYQFEGTFLGKSKEQIAGDVESRWSSLIRSMISADTLAAFHQAAVETAPVLAERQKLQREIAGSAASSLDLEGTAPYIDWGSVFVVNVLQPGQPDRILIVYGDTNLEARAPYFATTLDSDLRETKRWIAIIPGDLGVPGLAVQPNKPGLSYGFFDSLPVGRYQPGADVLTASAGTPAAYPVGNQPGWAIFDCDGEQFLVLPDGPQSGQIDSHLSVVDVTELQICYTGACFGPQSRTQHRFVRLGTSVIDDLSRLLLAGGVDHLLTPEAQRTRERDFSRFAPAPGKVAAPTTDTIDFSGAFGIYFWEAFFHIPFLMAGALNINRQFDEAQKWYQQIYDPSAGQIEGHPGDRYWQFLPFRDHRLETLRAAIQSPQAIAEYEEDPFDADAIARVRFGAYEKAIVMRYIDNLLDWGDSLFTQDSWEALTEAGMLYILAGDLLGSRPQTTVEGTTQASLTYDELYRAGADNTSQLLAALEHALGTTSAQGNGYQPFRPAELSYFCMIENSEFVQYWDRIEDRLFKLRHCLNIKGTERHLALFQPPIDPRQLIRALASGQSLDAAWAGLDIVLPSYRFDVMVQQAKGITTALIQLGGALLAALEKKDSAALTHLRSTHERAILQLTTQLRTEAVDEAVNSLDALQISRNAAQLRYETYTHFIEQGLNPQENANQRLMDVALEALEAARGVRSAAVAAHLIPTIVGTSDGGFQPGSSVSEAASLSDAFGGIRSHRAGMAATSGQFARRAEEWVLQQRLAEHDVEQLERQLDAARIRQAVAQQALNIHTKSIEQANEMEEFLQRRFGTEELYSWVVKRLGAIYADTYQLTLQQAQAAQACYRFERNTDAINFIQPGYSNTQAKHLLSGEELMAALNHMEVTYRKNNVRTLEIEKTISLRQGAPEALQQLLDEGACAFSLPEELFDRDFPGHYCRKIVSVAISIPAIVGPYQNVHATLIQQKSYVVLTPDMTPINYLLSANSLDPSDTQERPPAHQLRSYLEATQQIALSKGMNDAGLFELNFHDERYLPFEGTGVVSEWELRMPKANNRFHFDSISDVIVHLRYTALDGGDKLRQLVNAHPRVRTDGSAANTVRNRRRMS